MLATFTDAVVVTTLGQIPVAYVGRGDSNQIALLNTRFPGPMDYASYLTHMFTGEEKQRNQRKQARRLLVYGTGIITSAVLTITADGSRTMAYQYSALSADPAEGLLWSQGLIPLIGRTFSVKLEVSGTAIEPNEIQLQYILYG